MRRTGGPARNNGTLFRRDLAIAAAARLHGVTIRMVFDRGDADARWSGERRT
jgi:hypothetical protein